MNGTLRLVVVYCVAVLLVPYPAGASRLERKIKRLVATSVASRGAFIGILVVDEKGRKLVSLNADRQFTPASNTKLFSTALALERLGPGKVFETRVEQRGTDLVLIGTGDANLSGRVLPYVPHSDAGAALKVVDELADQIVASGIHEVEGNIVGDDTAFLYEPLLPSWTLDDILSDDGVPTSALVVNDSAITVRITPGIQDGSRAQITTDPPIRLFGIESSVTTGSPQTIKTDRVPNMNVWRLWGSLPANAQPYTEKWAVPDGAMFAAMALKYSLEQRGVKVDGSVAGLHRLPGEPFIASPAGHVVARHISLPLLEDLRLTDKISQNLHADLLLSDVGGSREEGLRELGIFLTQAGIAADQYRFYDGSGLSRWNLVTPEAVVTLLQYMARSAHKEDWMTLLPVSGVDGSLTDRMTETRVKNHVRAKTGSLHHVSALSGYAETRKGHKLTFSILLNNATAGTTQQRELIDKICLALVE